MVEVNKIYNMDCLKLMEEMDEHSIDNVITSPPYNTARNNVKAVNRKTQNRYDDYNDVVTNDEYMENTVKLFNGFDRVLKENGVVLYNMSYGSEFPEKSECMFRTVNEIITKTNFTLGDVVIWKKKSATPNSVSPNKLTRIVEFVYVFVRRNEFKTYKSNKKVKSYRERTGQANYENVFNFIEAKNNDGSTSINKATFSSDFVKKLMDMYVPAGSTVFDPFMGTGTTAVACVDYGCNYIGTEISATQCEYAEERINKFKEENNI